MGNDILYPSGKAKMTACEFTVPEGGPVVPHTHSFPVLIMIQEGEIEPIQGKKSYIYKAWDSFLEDIGVVHESKKSATFRSKQLSLQWVLSGRKLWPPWNKNSLFIFKISKWRNCNKNYLKQWSSPRCASRRVRKTYFFSLLNGKGGGVRTPSPRFWRTVKWPFPIQRIKHSCKCADLREKLLRVSQHIPARASTFVPFFSQRLNIWKVFRNGIEIDKTSFINATTGKFLMRIVAKCPFAAQVRKKAGGAATNMKAKKANAAEILWKIALSVSLHRFANCKDPPVTTSLVNLH